MSGRSTYDDPLKNFKFRVEVEGFVRAGFSEVSGLEMAMELAEYREGGDNNSVKKSPTLVSYTNVTLKRGVLSGSTQGGDLDFASWFDLVRDTTSSPASTEPRKTVDILLMRPDGTVGVRYRLYNALPANFKPFGDLNATGSDNLIEELEIAFEDCDRFQE